MTEYIKSLRKFVGHAPIIQCGASIIVVNKENQIMLQLRKDNHCWGYAGGSIEIDEVAEETAKRELFEETGLTASGLELYGVFSGPDYHYVYPNGDEVTNVDIVFICREYTGTLKCDESEVASLRFFPLDDLPENLSPPVAKIISRYASENKPLHAILREVDSRNRDKVTAFIIKHWFSSKVMIRGEAVDMTKVDGYAVFDENDAEIIGLITYFIKDRVCEITSFDSTIENKGIGTLLINEVIKKAKNAGCTRVQLITTNDDINAIRFYQKRGFDLAGVYHGAIERERLLKPEIPLIGQNNIPILHEIEFVMEI
jgi:8-oxo-dGTP pyrophosphatase MutT (NUDIX family)